eukprot:c8687_g1_i1.p1 GENE.c8687_g1_i1~~c8687_g1_i1.p1  ORF type:complete len:307 (+),score=76.61 c8687_g1_i1:63-923(+)
MEDVEDNQSPTETIDFEQPANEKKKSKFAQSFKKASHLMGEKLNGAVHSVREAEIGSKVVDKAKTLKDAVKEADIGSKVVDKAKALKDAVKDAEIGSRVTKAVTSRMRKASDKEESAPGRETYLDFNATTPISKEVGLAMMPFMFEIHGNPSSAHAHGRRVKVAIDHARRQIAECLGCEENEIIFTSGGTESNNLAIKGVVEWAARDRRAKDLPKPHVITSPIEHPAVLEVCKYLQEIGMCDLTLVEVSGDGVVRLDSVKSAITPSTVLISIMHSNNEVGSIQPIQ